MLRKLLAIMMSPPNPAGNTVKDFSGITFARLPPRFRPLLPRDQRVFCPVRVAGERAGVRGRYRSLRPPHPDPLPHSRVHSASGIECGGEGAEPWKTPRGNPSQRGPSGAQPLGMEEFECHLAWVAAPPRGGDLQNLWTDSSLREPFRRGEFVLSFHRSAQISEALPRPWRLEIRGRRDQWSGEGPEAIRSTGSEQHAVSSGHNGVSSTALLTERRVFKLRASKDFRSLRKSDGSVSTGRSPS